MEITPKPERILLADEDFVYGVNIDAYPNITRLKSTGNFAVMTLEEAQEQYDIARIGTSDEDLLVLNPYSNRYWSINESDLQDKFISDKAIAIKRACELFGAHCCILKEKVVEAEEKKRDIHAGGKYNGSKSAGGDVNINNNKKHSVNLSNEISFLNLNTPIASPSEIEKHLHQTGLVSNGTFKGFLDDLYMGRKLGGCQHIRVRFLRELQEALGVALKLDALKIINIAIDYKSTSSKVHEFEKELWVYFDEVPQETQNMFNAGLI